MCHCRNLKKVGRALVALTMICGPCTDGDSFFTNKTTLSSMSLANTGIPSLDSLLMYYVPAPVVNLCPSVSTL